MITVGSVRGKLWFETVPRVAQGLRSLACPPPAPALSVGGHTRFVPACTESVGWPHWAQKGVRAFQSMMARA
jgi:hypothetical protein